jgi:hypothetical protein
MLLRGPTADVLTDAAVIDDLHDVILGHDI